MLKSVHRVSERPLSQECPPAAPSGVRQRSAAERAERTREDLAATIERQIIPRLLLAHGEDPGPAVCRDTAPPPNPDEIAAFARLAIHEDLPAALAEVEAACRLGLSLESVFLHLIAAAARFLGQEWIDDRRSFTEVTVGLGTLQQLVNVLGARIPPSPAHRGLVVLAAPQGEQHTLGLNIVGEFLRMAGWGVDVRLEESPLELVNFVHEEHVDAACFTVSNDKLLPPLAQLVDSVRVAPRNRDMSVLVGGPLPLEAFATEHGAVCLCDAPSAVQWLENHK